MNNDIFRVHGPTYNFNPEHRADFILVRDHHWRPEEQRSDVVLLANNNPGATLIFDHVVSTQLFPHHDCICLPLFLMQENRDFAATVTSLPNIAPVASFNFVINKPRPHRVLLLNALTKLTMQTDYYSLCWQDTFVIDPRWYALTSDTFLSSLLTEIPTWAPRSHRHGGEQVMRHGLRRGCEINAKTYADLLKKNIFDATAISIITEPTSGENECIMTEKTLHAWYSGNLPLWVGGFHTAQWWREQGFDVYDDIMDHSYELIQDPWHRCWQALWLNRELLLDSELAVAMFLQVQTRAAKNLHLLHSGRLEQNLLHKISNLQGRLRHVVKNLDPVFQNI